MRSKTAHTASAPSNPTKTDAHDALQSQAEILDAIRPDMDAAPDTPEAPITVDIPTIVTMILLASPRIASHRDELIAKLTDFDPTVVDRLDVRALGLLAAHQIYMRASGEAPAAPSLRKRGLALRNKLNLVAEMLVEFGVLTRADLAGLAGGNGYKACGNDLRVLSTALGDHWDAVAQRVPLTREQVVEARVLGTQIAAADQQRNVRTPPVLEAARDRQRAFTLVANTYDNVRQGLAYARWKAGDANVIAPSIYAQRTRAVRRKRVAAKPGTPTPPPVAPAASATPATPATHDPPSHPPA